MLSPKAQELIAKAEIVSFASWYEGEMSETIALFERANQERRYLTDAEFAVLQRQDSQSLEAIEAAKILRDRASDIVDRSRSQVLEHFPQITQPGGKLYPAKRAENCWRDFWHFLRCIHYGIAGKNSDYTSAEGLHYMNLLYQELDVPLDAMIVGLEAVKEIGLEFCSVSKPAEFHPYFDRLIDRLRAFEGNVS